MQETAENTRNYYHILSKLEDDPTYIVDYIKYRLDFYDRNATIKTKRIRNKKRARKLFINRMLVSGSVFSKELYDKITERLHKQRETLYEWSIPKPKGSWKALFHQSIKNLSDYTGVSMDKVTQCFTSEQIWYYNDCMTWDYLQSFKEWEAYNQNLYVKNAGWLSDEQKDLLEFLKSKKD